VKSGDPNSIEREMHRLRRFADFAMHGPYLEDMGFAGRETHMFLMEFPHLLEHMLIRTLERSREIPSTPEKKSATKRRPSKRTEE
jgi:hypothetical protein